MLAAVWVQQAYPWNHCWHLLPSAAIKLSAAAAELGFSAAAAELGFIKYQVPEDAFSQATGGYHLAPTCSNVHHPGSQIHTAAEVSQHDPVVPGNTAETHTPRNI